MTRALIAVGIGPPILSPAPPFELMALPGDAIWDDDPLIFGLAGISSERRAAHGIVMRPIFNAFGTTVAVAPTNRPFTNDAAIYSDLAYDRTP
jgi:hypothetical protein